MKIGGTTKVFGLLGHPVAHSKSPDLHNPAFADHRIDAVYVCFDVDPSTSEGLGHAIRTLGLSGVNLTVPFKQRILDELDAVEGMAGVIGAVNTVVARDGRLVGHNTDAEGFVSGVREAFGDVFTGGKVVVLGAGGAGLAVGAGAAQAGASEVVWLNRTVARAEAVAARVGGALPGVVCRGAALDAATFVDEVSNAAVIAQATSGAGADQVGTFDAGAVADDAVWVDLNYWMDEPPLMAALEARGVRVQDGMPMLIHQAALAFQHFTGIFPDPARMRERIG